MDIGQPRDYLVGLSLYLRSLRARKPELLASGPHVVGNVLLDPTATLGEGCVVGPDVCVGPGCVIEPGVRLSKCTILRGAKVKQHACVVNSLIGWHSVIGRWAVRPVGRHARGSRCTVRRLSPRLCVSFQLLTPLPPSPCAQRLDNCCVLGEDVQLGDELYINGGIVLPHKEIKANVRARRLIERGATCRATCCAACSPHTCRRPARADPFAADCDVTTRRLFF